MDPNNIEGPRYRNAQEYAQALRSWMSGYHTCCSMQWMAAQAAHAQVSQMHLQRAPWPPGPPRPDRPDPYASRRPPQPPTGQQDGRPPGTNQPQAQVQVYPLQGPLRMVARHFLHIGVVYRVPSFWKRIAAEMIDFTLLFYIKMLVSLSLMSELNLDHIDSVVFFRSIFGTEEIFDSFNELDYEKAFAITFEVIALEIINRVIITIFETMCLYRARVRGQHVGATPGKRFMGLKVVSCDYVRDLGLGHILVLPAGRVSLKNAFLRSVIKNFTIAFFLPACLTMFFFKHNRTAYDVIAHTIVVEGV